MNQIKNSKIFILILSAFFSATFLFGLSISAFAAEQTHTIDGSFNITVQGSGATNVIDSSLETASTLDTNILVCFFVFLLLGGVLFIFVKSRSLVPTTAAHAKVKSQSKIPLFAAGLIVAVFSLILISMILVKSSAFADKSTSDITYSSNVLVDEQGNVLNNDLKIINGSSRGIVIKEIVAPSELNGWKAKLEKDLLIKAGETVESSWDTTTVPIDTLNKVKSAGGSMSLNISINITEDYTLDFNAFDVDLSDVTYSGQAQTPKVTTSFYKEGEDYSVEYTNNKDVGTATITIKGIGEYDGQKAYTFNILPREVSLIWSDTAFTYDKNSHLPKATAENIVGEDKVNVTVNTADGSDAINAGKYTASAISIDNSNYCLPSDISCSFVINQATLTLSWDEQSLKHTYNGGEHIPTATISGAYEGDTVNLTISGKAKTAGTHTATASIDNNNYKFDKEPTKEFSISRASVTVSGITAKSKEYDGGTGAVLDCTQATLTGKVAGDDLSVTASGAFEDQNVGVGKNVSISGLTLQGGAKDNYELSKDGQQASATADIEARTVLLNWSATTFTYNCKNQKPTATVDGSSIVTGETVEVNAYDTEGGKDFGDYEIKATGLSNNNYQLPSDASCKFNITKADIDVTGITVSTKEYDKTTGANIATVTISGIYSSDSDKVDVETTGTFADANVGVGKTVTITNTLSGERSFNYKISSSVIKSTTADIVAKEVTLSWSATALPYNSEVQKPTATVDASSIISGDTVEVATYEGEGGKTFGDYSITAKTLNNDNYKLPKDATCNFKITKASIKVSNITAKNKVYDGGTTATLITSKAVLDGIYDADKNGLYVTAEGTFDNKEVGNGKTVNLGNLMLGGTSVLNYELASSGQQDSTTADITQAPITVSGITATKKTYDGNTDATIDCTKATLTGKVEGEELSVTATGTFEDQNVGKTKKVTISGLTLQGGAKDNYVLADSGQQDSTTADIEEREVTITWGTTTLQYNGTAQAPSPTLGNIVDTETVTATVSGAETTIGTGYEATITGLSSTNYTLPTDESKLKTTFSITQASITVSGITADKKIYDGNTDATIDCTKATLTGKVEGEELSVTATGAFEDQNVGKTKKVTISGLTLQGTAKDNYVLAESGQQDSTTAEIEAREVTITWGTTTLQYNGTAQAPSPTLGNIVDTETVTATVSGAETTIGTGYEATITGLSSTNYTLPTDESKLKTTFSITQAPITVSGITANKKTYDGNTDATFDCTKATLTGKVEGDDLSVTADGAFETSGVSKGIKVNIHSLFLQGIAKDNYVLADSGQQDSTTADIEAKEVTLTWSATKFTYNTQIQKPTASVDESSIISGETVKVAEYKYGQEDSKDYGDYDVTAVTLDNDNYKLPQDSTCKYSITQADVIVTEVTVSDKPYDKSVDATITSQGNVEGIYEADKSQVTVTSTGKFDDENAGTGKNVTITSELSGDRSSNYKISDSSQRSAYASISKVDPTFSIKSAYINAWRSYGSGYYGLYPSDDVVCEFSATGVDGSVLGGAVSWSGTTSQISAGYSISGSWTFKPGDTTNYNNLTGTYTLKAVHN